MYLIILLYCNEAYCFDWTISLAEVITIVGATFAFAIALWQYSKAQKWKRTEFILSYYSTALNSFNVRRGMLMLDWNCIDIPLRKDEIPGKSNFWFTDKLFRSALRDHFTMPEGEGFSNEETVIRFVMDEFLEKLGSCYPFIKTGLIKKEDISGDIIYCIKVIGDVNNRSKDSSTRSQLWDYIVNYDFANIISLCKLYGYEIISQSK